MGVKPVRISASDTIGIVSPASCPLDEEIYRQGVNYLRTLGYNVIESEHVLDKRGYLAGKDVDRVNDLNKMFLDPAIDAIICSRGGYGTPRIIDRIDFEAIQKNSKIFVGYSDITSLNLAIWQKTGLVTFSGSMVAVEMGSGIAAFTEQKFWKTLTSVEPIGLLSNPPDLPIKIINHGKTEGRLLGGCLSLINVLLGTPFCPDFKDAILFIEDIDEEPYRVDRYLAQLKLAGVLNQVVGIVVGQFIDCKPKDPEKPSLQLSEIFQDYFGPLNIPIITNFAYGHGPIKHIIPIGVHAILDTDLGGLMITESAVIEKLSV
ncbi:MAG: LD-carboxypeptidase [bacterium]|nr:MAG: LD-carboxypeptidase [bacterium]